MNTLLPSNRCARRRWRTQRRCARNIYTGPMNFITACEPALKPSAPSSTSRGNEMTEIEEGGLTGEFDSDAEVLWKLHRVKGRSFKSFKDSLALSAIAATARKHSPRAAQGECPSCDYTYPIGKDPNHSCAEYHPRTIQASPLPKPEPSIAAPQR